jgi:hypothetical protein
MLEAVLALTAIIGAVGSVLFVTERQKNSQLKQTILNIHQGETDEIHQNKASELLYSAQKKADAILTQAELAAIKTEASSSISSKLLEEKLAEYEKKYAVVFQQTVDKIQGDYGGYLDKSKEEYQTLLSQLATQAQTLSEQVNKTSESRINEVLLKFEQNLSTFLSSSEQRSLAAIELEVKSARQLIETYKQEQLRLIDENIVAVLERTLSLVLKNNLTLRDQLELVYESLEKAKAEKFFA